MFKRDVVINKKPWPELKADIGNFFCKSQDGNIGLTTKLLKEDYVYVGVNHIDEVIYIKKEEYPDYIIDHVGWNPS